MKPTQSKSTERGEGQFGSLLMLAVFIVLALAAKDMGPIWWDNYQFQDRITTIAGSFPPNKEGDTRAMAAVKKAIIDAGLSAYLDDPDRQCSVTSNGGIGGLRKVACTYTREYTVLGQHKSQTFEVTAERPMF
jgi:hypothetical protein